MFVLASPWFVIYNKAFVIRQVYSYLLALRSLIIDEIVNEGGDIVNGYFPGNFATIASKFCVKYDTVVKIWRQFVANNDHERPKPRSAGVTILQTHDLAFIELLKTGKPSLTSGDIVERSK